MAHTIQIIIDNAGVINLKIDDWCCQYNASAGNIDLCVNDILNALLSEDKNCHWGQDLDGHDHELADDWASLEAHCGSVVIDTSLELAEGVGGYAGEALRLELQSRGVTF